MFIALGLASAAISVPFQESASYAPASLHPASATFVVQFPDLQKLIEAFRTTGAVRMLEDPDLQTAIGQVMAGEGADPVDPIGMLMEQYARAVDRGEMPPLLDYLQGMESASASVDFAGGDVLAFVQGIETAEDKGFFVSQNLGIRFVADFIDEPTAEKVTEFLIEAIGEDGPRGMELSARALTMPEGAMGFGASGIRDWTFVPSEAGNGAGKNGFETTMHLVAGGKRLALFMGNVDSADYVRALAANTVPSPAASLFEPGRAAFKKAPAAPAFELFLRPFVEDMVAMNEPNAVPLLDIAEALIGPAASLAIRGGHWRMGIDSGQFVLEGIHDPSRGGPLSGVIGAQPLDRSALELVHPDALVTSVTSLDSKVLANLIQQFATEEDPTMLDEIEERFHFRPDRDLAAPLGGAVSYSLPALTSLFSAPNVMGAVALRDKEAFTKGMDGLMGMAESLGEDVQLVRDDYKGAMMYTLSFTGDVGFSVPGLPFDPASFFKPTFTIMGDRVLLTTLPTHAKKEIRRVGKLADGEEPPVHEKIMAMGDLNGATTVGYADWPQFFGMFYTQIKGIAPLLAGGGDLPINPAMLPDAAILTRHFQPSENWTRIQDGKVMQYAKSSLGTEAFFLPASLAGLFTVGTRFQGTEPLMVEAVAVDEVEWEDAAEEAPEPGSPEALLSTTEESLVDLDVALTLYQYDHKGAAPASLDALLETSTKYPNGYLESDALPMDGWGHAFIYAKTDEAYRLYSMGPNGVDDGGAGDDISPR
ncbi:Bacterial type II secretion system protein G [Planctomycetes bacterium Poly30]|uniref:Bacterial type II secretion system protein G n=1 Tax=Saltatorellus ferox TaxID=2528018 RepID=A0A518F183_9BACT|nr:Bacterial type II secretion system protein G [Planctomycetes bacterium Poly30]